MSLKTKPKITSCPEGYICTSPPPYDCTSVLFKGVTPIDAYKGWKLKHDVEMDKLWRQMLREHPLPVMVRDLPILLMPAYGGY